MQITNERAQEISVYVEGHPESEIGRWPVEIGGEKKILSYYRFPIKLLKYNVHNGRLAMEIKEWESLNKRELDPNEQLDAKIIKDLLLSIDGSKSSTLKEDLEKKGQMEPGVVTFDGIVINGNRRMALLESLYDEQLSGKWQYLEAVRLPENISQTDLWKIEAGLQLSKDKIAEYHPVNELLKIKEGTKAGLQPAEIAAAMYGRTLDEIEMALKRLDLIDDFLDFFGQPQNYGLIKKFGLHEFFIDLQKTISTEKDRGVPAKELKNRQNYAFVLIRAGIKIQSNQGKRNRITHWDIRDLTKIYKDVDAYAEFTKTFQQFSRDPKKLLNLPPENVIEDFRTAQEVLKNKDDRGRPVILIERAIKALQSIDRTNKHFREDRARIAFENLKITISQIEKDLN